jgi:MFS family permease
VTLPPAGPARNVALYPWQRFFQNLLFWQAIWFLYFQQELSASEAILLYAVYDLTVTLLEVPSGWFSDRLGRRMTLLISGTGWVAGSVLLAVGGDFWIFMLGQAALGAGSAFMSGTDASLLYESLVAEGREDEVEAQELRAWRFSFSALGLSAVTGGALSLLGHPLAFGLSGAAAAVALAITARFVEPPHSRVESTEIERLTHMVGQLRQPVLGWLFALSLVMYGYSHLPFVFGQPFILEAVGGVGLSASAPLVSGGVVSLMMLVSVGASMVAERLRDLMGLRAILLLAFGMQVLLPLALSLSASVLLIAVLLLRMVPDALSRPFITARIMPLLSDDSRATFLSLKSLCGRIAFAGSLALISGAGGAGEMEFEAIRRVLGGYAAAGAVIWLALWWWSRRVALERQ